MYRYAYLIGVGILATFWIIIFILRKDLRKQQLFLSFLLVPFAPLTDILWFYHDYWRPEYVYHIVISGIPIGLESPLFAFFVGGISGVIYEVVFRKRHSFGKPRTFFAFSLILLGLLISIILKQTDINTVWVSIITLTIITTVMVIIDHDLIYDAIISGFYLTLLIILLYIIWLNIFPDVIQKFWLDEALSGITLFKIPIEELLWFISIGMCAGIFYEFWLNANKYTNKK